uniref:DNA pilot protein n=1 Tax=Dulem virus 79 TaxID=3145790 RepID=A0AAU8B4Z8_9VIRU
MGLGSVVGGAISAVGSLLGGRQQQQSAREQMAMQKEFAQNGIRWKVADAKAAGLHPLAALGAQTFSYNPVAVGDGGIADAMAQMGQGIDRAVAAKQTAEERKLEQAFVDKQRELDIRQKEKNIQLLDSEIYRNNSAAYESLKRASMPPAMPSYFRKGFDGQGDAKPGNSTLDSINKYAWQFDEEGKRAFTYSPDYKQQYEDMPIIEYWPLLSANFMDIFNKITGRNVDGRRWSWRDLDYIPDTRKRSNQTRDIMRRYYRNSQLPW